MVIKRKLSLPKYQITNLVFKDIYTKLVIACQVY